ncbi:hypothetical protein ACOMHN_034213 [Nucella lapillus]
MDARFDEVRQEMRDLRQESAAMQEELKGLREEVCHLREENQDLTERNAELAQLVDSLQMKTDDLEGRSKRNNLLYFGLTRRDRDRSTCKMFLSIEMERTDSEPTPVQLAQWLFIQTMQSPDFRWIQ